MAVIELKNDKVSLKTEPNSTILESTLAAGIPHAHACGGKGLCSTCRVYVDKGLENVLPRNTKEESIAQKLGLLPEVRLACQSQIEGDVEMRRLVLDDVDEAIIIKHGSALKPRSLGEEIDASVLFVDIADYTAFTESTSAYDVVHVLNRYFHIAGSVIKKHGGRIIDYYGDGFLAIFGLNGEPNHAQHTQDAGYEFCDEVDKFNHAVNDLIHSDFRIRLGAHSGKVIWCTIGIEGMQKEAAIGDTVNLASRIENANKTLNTRFLCSEEFYARLSDPCQVVGEYEISPKGKSDKVKVVALDKRRVSALS